jgi:hypothetical protein
VRMQTPSMAELLTVWERGQSQGPLARALELLGSFIDAPSEVLARASIGQRDAWLFALREVAFGPQLAGLATCPNCSQRLEIAVDVCAIRALDTQKNQEVRHVAVGPYDVAFRLPNSLDLAQVARVADAGEAQRRLRACCLLGARRGGEEIDVGELPGNVAETVEREMQVGDPMADIQLEIECPCGNRWAALLDVASFLWRELDALSRRVIQEVHALARAYGWSERDILAMSPWRRQAYLQVAGSVDGRSVVRGR